MALKGSGVRASSAPYLHLGPIPMVRSLRAVFISSVPNSGNRWVFGVGRFRRFTASLLVCLVMLGLLSARADADDKGKLGIFILPQPNGSYRVALSYAGRAPQTQVKKEIAALVQNTQGTLLSAPTIQDYSLDPSNLKKFPVTTSALFQMTQGVAGTPSYLLLKPYLAAFRGQKQLEILIEVPAEQGDPQVQTFKKPELNVSFHRSKGIHRYQVEILAASGNLPDPIFSIPSSQMQENTPPVANSLTKSRGVGLGSVLVAVACGVLAGLVIYFLAVRVVLSPKSAKP
jgi:hypothetical protein